MDLPVSIDLPAAVPDLDCAAVTSRRKDRHRFLPSVVIVDAFEHFYRHDGAPRIE
jgi:hypothetical protein